MAILIRKCIHYESSCGGDELGLIRSGDSPEAHEAREIEGAEALARRAEAEADQAAEDQQQQAPDSRTALLR